MMPERNVTRAGKISKPYGLNGSVHLILDPAAANLIKSKNPLFIEIDGQRVPFFMEDYEQVSSDQAIAKFEFIDRVEEARSIAGCDVYLEETRRVRAKESRTELQDIVGFDAFDLHAGHLGTITGYMQEELNPLFLVRYRDDEIMIPATEEIIAEIDHRKRIIRFDLPEGLLDL